MIEHPYKKRWMVLVALENQFPTTDEKLAKSEVLSALPLSSDTASLIAYDFSVARRCAGYTLPSCITSTEYPLCPSQFLTNDAFAAS